MSRHQPVTITCYQCKEPITSDAEAIEETIEAHVNREHPVVLGSGVNAQARNVSPSITCLVCGRTSYNENDVREGYCGYCHAFTGRPSL